MYTENELVTKAQAMYDKKMYKDLENFLEPLVVIYPENDVFKKIAAFNYLQRGDALRGAELFAGIAENSVEESRTLEEILKNLYYNGNYSDLLYFYDRKIMINNVNTAFYYGVSLYKKGRYDESYKSLIYAKNNTFMLPELYFYIGLNLDKKGKTGESLSYIKTAYESDRFNKDYKKALIDLYRKSGLFKEAELLLRSR
jgi:tetratricopeptide (TPR) repeat protein